MPFPLVKQSQQRPFAPAQQHHTASMQPAPVSGLASNTSLLFQDPQTAVILKNFFCRRYGNELRAGYKRWVNNIPGKVLSIMPYQPPRGAGSLFVPRLFAASDNGNIYEVTGLQPNGFVPPVAVAIPGQIRPGVFGYTQFATAAANYLCIASAGGGYWTFDHTGGWVNRTGAIVGPGAAAAINFDFVMSWKNRLWFIENNTCSGWYLPVNSIAGNANLFDFGPLFVNGGDLAAIASWTVDGGDGIDDKLVICASGGDVLIYEGTDPTAAATFQIKGRWFVGRVPFGRRFMDKYGGDLRIICENGVERMSNLTTARGLLSGAPSADDGFDRYMETIGREVRRTRGLLFWKMMFVPGEEAIIIISPNNTTRDGLQYVWGLRSEGWSEFTNMPMASADVFEGDVYFGTPTGTVCKAFAAATDDELFDGTVGRQPLGDIQTAFVPQNGDIQSLKRMLQVMPMFQAPSAPQVKLQLNTEWTLKAVGGSPVYTADQSAKWNVSLWNVGVWGGQNNTWHAWAGVVGLGVYASLRMQVVGAPGTLFTSWKLLTEAGGIM